MADGVTVEALPESVCCKYEKRKSMLRRQSGEVSELNQ